MDDPIDKWTKEDFIEPQSQTPVEDDPWALDSRLDKSVSGVSHHSRDTESAGDEFRFPQEERLRASNENGFTDEFRDAFPELDDDIDVGDRDGAFGYNDTLADDDDLNVNDFDTPDPLYEFQEKLHEPLHDTRELSSALNRRLLVNEWLAKIEGLGQNTMSMVTETLMSFNSRKFYLWMQWLSRQEWDQQTLTKFFRYWCKGKDYQRFSWQIVWNKSSKCWISTYSEGAWTLDRRLLLVRRRIDFPMNSMIDEEWLWDWETISPTALARNLFNSFAQFALYRSHLNPREKWRLRTT